MESEYTRETPKIIDGYRIFKGINGCFIAYPPRGSESKAFYCHESGVCNSYEPGADVPIPPSSDVVLSQKQMIEKLTLLISKQ